MQVTDERRYSRRWLRTIPWLALLQFIIAGIAVTALFAVRCSVLWGNSGFFSFSFVGYRPIAYVYHQHASRIDLPVLYAYSLLLLFVHSLVVGIGNLKKRPWALQWARITPIMTIPLWVTFSWYLAESLAFARANQGICTDDTVNPLISSSDLRAAAAYSALFWLAVSIIYMWKLRLSESRSVLANGSASSPKSRAIRGAALVAAALLLLLIFRLPDGRMLIHDAASYGWTNTVDVLRITGQSVNARTRDNSTPLHYAADSGRLDTVKSLLKHGASIDAQDRYGRTAIMLAATSDFSYRAPNADSYATFVELIRHGANVRLRDDQGLTLASCIIDQSPYPSGLVRMMVERGVPLNDRVTNNNVNFTLLGYAVEQGKPSDVDYLLSHGARMYPLLVERANPRMLEHLLDRGFDVNSRDEDGRSPLHYVLEREEMHGTHDGRESALVLLARGANINARDSHNQTLLHLAAEYPEKEWVRFLLNHGADPNIHDWGHFTPYDIARDSKWPDLCRAMEKSGKLSRQH